MGMQEKEKEEEEEEEEDRHRLFRALRKQMHRGLLVVMNQSRTHSGAEDAAMP
jgi:hypothetical protein